MAIQISPTNLEPWPPEYDELFSSIHNKKLTFTDQSFSTVSENYENIEVIDNKHEKNICWGPFGLIVVSLFIVAIAIIIQNKLEQEKPCKFIQIKVLMNY